MPRTTRKRIEVPEDVYTAIAREARYLHIPVATWATMILQEQCDVRVQIRKANEHKG